MKPISREMIKLYGIKDFDFMGYDIKRKESLSFHHLIVPHRYCKEQGLGEGYYLWNGAILMLRTAHEYLRLIECKDIEIFNLVSSEMVDINVKGYLDKENIDKIDELLKYFEREHANSRNKKGTLLLKEEYIRRGLK